MVAALDSGSNAADGLTSLVGMGDGGVMAAFEFFFLKFLNGQLNSHTPEGLQRRPLAFLSSSTWNHQL